MLFVTVGTTPVPLTAPPCHRYQVVHIPSPLCFLTAGQDNLAMGSHVAMTVCAVLRA